MKAAGTQIPPWGSCVARSERFELPTLRFEV